MALKNEQSLPGVICYLLEDNILILGAVINLYKLH